MRKRSRTNEATTHPSRSIKRSALVIGCSIVVCALLGGSVLYAVLRLQAPPRAHPQQIAQAPIFKPVVGDVNDAQDDDDPDVTVQQSLIPGFQFKQGGYTLAGT